MGVEVKPSQVQTHEKPPLPRHGCSRFQRYTHNLLMTDTFYILVRKSRLCNAIKKHCTTELQDTDQEVAKYRFNSFLVELFPDLSSSTVTYSFKGYVALSLPAVIQQ